MIALSSLVSADLAAPGAAPPGPPPEVELVPLEALCLDPSYQRALSRRSKRLIRKIAEAWDWTRFKPLTVRPSGDGRLEVIDGQHSALAAAARRDIPRLPAVVIAGETNAAAAFVGINRDRLAVTPLQIFWAEVEAGAEEAIDIRDGAADAGVEILRGPRSAVDMRPGQTMAIGALRQLARQGGRVYVRRALAAALAARCDPIEARHIKALAKLLFAAEYRGAVSAERLAELWQHTAIDDLAERVRRREDRSTDTATALAAEIYRQMQRSGRT